MLRWLKRRLADNIQADKPRVGASMLFFEDGSAEIHTTSGFVLNEAQNTALREFMLDQMDEALTAFENARRRLRFVQEAERIIPFPTSREIN